MNTRNGISAPVDGLRWLFVDMNSFFASCEQQQEPDLRGKPIAVAPMLVDSTCAIAASYEAKAFGITTGTPIWEAKKRCPHLTVVQARPKLYVEYHHRIREAIESRIPIDAVMSIDEVACKLDKVQGLPKAHQGCEQKMRILCFLEPALVPVVTKVLYPFNLESEPLAVKPFGAQPLCNPC